MAVGQERRECDEIHALQVRLIVAQRYIESLALQQREARCRGDVAARDDRAQLTGKPDCRRDPAAPRADKVDASTSHALRKDLRQIDITLRGTCLLRHEIVLVTLRRHIPAGTPTILPCSGGSASHMLVTRVP
jgi:hypothetical protein